MITSPFSAVAQESSRRDIKITVGGKVVGRVVGEDIPLEYPHMVWRADPSIGMAADGTIYVALYMRIFVSHDGGRTWSSNNC